MKTSADACGPSESVVSVSGSFRARLRSPLRIPESAPSVLGDVIAATLGIWEFAAMGTKHLKRRWTWVPQVPSITSRCHALRVHPWLRVPFWAAIGYVFGEHLFGEGRCTCGASR